MKEDHATRPIGENDHPVLPKKAHLALEPHLLLLDASCFLQGWGCPGSQRHSAAPCPRQPLALGAALRAAGPRTARYRGGCGRSARERPQRRCRCPAPGPPPQHPGPRRHRGAAARSASRGGGGAGEGGGGSSEDGGGGGESWLLRLLFFRARLGCQLFLCFLRCFYGHGQQQQRGAAGGRR